jgi:hypothetical protein
MLLVACTKLSTGVGYPANGTSTFINIQFQKPSYTI